MNRLSEILSLVGEATSHTGMQARAVVSRKGRAVRARNAGRDAVFGLNLWAVGLATKGASCQGFPRGRTSWAGPALLPHSPVWGVTHLGHGEPAEGQRPLPGNPTTPPSVFVTLLFPTRIRGSVCS